MRRLHMVDVMKRSFQGGELKMENALTRLSRILHIVSSGWVLILAGVIFADVVGRTVFNHPLLGTAEIVKNSIVAITFLQIPLAIMIGAMLRTTIVLDAVGPKGRRIIELGATLLALIFFVALAVGSFEPLIEAWRIGEYEGEGAMRVPTYPVRAIILIMAVLTSFILVWQLIRLSTGNKHII
jgi:TRAP-type C4-dicarboxylate transport system permease small subunit